MRLPRSPLPFVLGIALVAISATRASADSILGWPQPSGPGTSITITYSYGNLFDGGFNTFLTPAEIRLATETALGLWARYVPLNFYEVPDAGPRPSDQPYSAVGAPEIRLGYHSGVVGQANGTPAHAFYPVRDGTTSGAGLEGDVHFANTTTGWPAGSRWGFADRGPLHMPFMGVLLHELGHAIGLPHLAGIAVMSAVQLYSFGSPEYARLFPTDIAAARAIYGAGVGSVHPLNAVPTPEPATLALVALGASLAAIHRRRSARRVR